MQTSKTEVLQLPSATHVNLNLFFLELEFFENLILKAQELLRGFENVRAKYIKDQCSKVSQPTKDEEGEGDTRRHGIPLRVFARVSE